MTTFKALGLSAPLLKAVEQLGFTSPTDVQEKVIPVLLETENDLVALAQTGTGKTAAFGLPLLQRLTPGIRQTQALILSPTRELCLQITNELGLYGQNMPEIKIVPIYGGANISEQAKKIKRGAQIIVATPGRLKDMIRRKMIDISALAYCVLDEADEMLNMGFYDDIQDILTHTPKDKKSWLFSATMPEEVDRIAQKFMRKPQSITVGTKNAGTKTVEHHYYKINSRDRYETLRSIVSITPDIFGCIFCRTKIETQKVADRLVQDGFKAAALHGDMSQGQRDTVMQSFRQQKIQLLIATDVAARGIDVEDITHVINYQLPDEVEVYTHRSGRTGRAGKLGISIMLVTKGDLRKLKLIENKLQTKAQHQELPSPQEMLESQIQRWSMSIKNTPYQPALEPYLETVYHEFEALPKEVLIQQLLSKEFGMIELKKSQKASFDTTVEFSETPKSKSKDQVRFYINLGSRDNYDWPELKDFIRSMTNLDKEAIFHVDVFKSFSYFTTEIQHQDLILNAFEGLILDQRKIHLEITEGRKTRFPKGSGGGFKKEKKSKDRGKVKKRSRR
jgi:ATP-dependent RNA helicase DeaD